MLFFDFFFWLFQAIKSFIMAKHPSATVGGKFPQHHLRAALKKGAETGKVMISHPTTLWICLCSCMMCEKQNKSIASFLIHQIITIMI